MIKKKVVDIGSRHDRLTVIEMVDCAGEANCKVRCDCGTEKNVLLRRLLSGHTRSCGCLSREKTIARSVKHNAHGSSIYNVWRAMVQRTTNPRSKDWADYGGRGISICETWLKFENFLSDMGRPDRGMELDRECNNLGYSKENCRWITHKENCRNRRNTIRVVFQDKEMSLIEASELSGINILTLRSRIKVGLSGDNLFQPTKKYSPRNKRMK